MKMKIVTYNINGLRPRIAQFGSLRKLLDSLDADIICFQETKLSRQELRADLVRTEGYESFFSCNCNFEKSRAGYSGVATFCRVRSAFLTDEVALPIAAEDGFTGLLENAQGFGCQKDEWRSIARGLEDFCRDELLQVDSEGRCVITDHGHFVLFNVYGPRAVADDMERGQFKLTFFKILQRRWERLLREGRKIFVVGDLNIAPASIDRCDAGPDFEKNEFRRWFRSLLVENGGQFFDVFRSKHPERREAYTCWPTNTGAEEFNFGARIDHILCAGSCLHLEPSQEGHNFVTCHVEECDILGQFKRFKPGSSPRWNGGRSIKLEGSDHVPVWMHLGEIPSIQQHSTPPLSTRYCPQVYGHQQTIVSMITRRQSSEQVETCAGSSTFPEDCSSRSTIGTPGSPVETRKKARQSRLSQLSLTSFFKISSSSTENSDRTGDEIKVDQADVSNSYHECTGPSAQDDESNNVKECETDVSASTPAEDGFAVSLPSQREKSNDAFLEWQRIQQLMQNSIPLCKGHNEPCVSRIVKKAGPNLGRRFYVCARAEGPVSNPEANCGYFKWAASNSKRKR